MAIEIKESFEVQATLAEVWRFVMDPRQVAACMPGAALDEVEDEGSFLGSIQVKVGAITARYSGRVRFTRVDADAHTAEMTAEAREPGGGTARATISSRLDSGSDGGTRLVFEARIDLTGRVMQVSRGMIQGVSHQLFQQFVERARQHLEAAAGGATPTPDAAAAEPLRIAPLVWRTLWSGIVRFLRRLLGRSGG